MARLDFSGLRDELVLDNFPTEKYPQGKRYVVREPRAVDVQRYLEIVDDTMSDDPERAKGAAQALEEFLTVDGKSVSVLRKFLGDSLNVIERDGLSASNARVLENTIVTTAMQGPQLAQTALETVIAGESLAAANRATRRAAAKKSSGSSRAAGSSSTRQPASRKAAPSSSGTQRRTTGRGSTRAS